MLLHKEPGSLLLIESGGVVELHLCVRVRAYVRVGACVCGQCVRVCAASASCGPECHSACDVRAAVRVYARVRAWVYLEAVELVNDDADEEIQRKERAE